MTGGFFPIRNSWHHAHGSIPVATYHTTYLGRRKPGKSHDFTVEQAAEREIGWLLILIFAGTATVAGVSSFPEWFDTTVGVTFESLAIDDERVGALHHAGAMSVTKSTPCSYEDAESTLLKRIQDLRYDILT
ncbi:hypothetical protein Patl1_06478 [Pistacia atlantica]|uniref:Uncharacterized protein n=1 Tax=Pistacia atlantica TaxID=434234 RepID=A0ACC1BP49_9ROSI|nr:hypothetical protein Patl1_06478 [Pistacia atlantica]